MDHTELREALLARLPENPHPLVLSRIDDIAALTHLVQLLEEALERTGVFFSDDKGGGKVNPLVEAIGKNRERLRRAMNDLDKRLGPAETPPAERSDHTKAGVALAIQEAARRLHDNPHYFEQRAFLQDVADGIYDEDDPNGPLHSRNLQAVARQTLGDDLDRFPADWKAELHGACGIRFDEGLAQNVRGAPPPTIRASPP